MNSHKSPTHLVAMESAGSVPKELEAELARVRSASAEMYAASLALAVKAADLVRKERNRDPDGDGRLTYRVQEVATMLGVSRDLIEKAISQRELKAVKMGGVTLVRKGDLEAYLEGLD